MTRTFIITVESDEALSTITDLAASVDEVYVSDCCGAVMHEDEQDSGMLLCPCGLGYNHPNPDRDEDD